MPKISTEYVTIFGKQHKYDLWFNAKSNTFYANKLPEDFLKFLKEAKVKEPESSEKPKFVKEVLPAAIKMWETASIKERIVIAYKANWGSKNITASKGNDSRINPMHSMSFTEEAILELEFEVYKEKEINGVKRYYRRYRDWNHPITDEPDDWDTNHTEVGYRFSKENAIIDWTPEREASMVAIYTAIEQLIRKFKGIVSAPEAFLQLLDKGTVLLEDKRDAEKE